MSLSEWIILYHEFPSLIQLEDLDSDSSDKKGVSFELYCVGTVGDSGEPVFDTKYNITAYPKTAEETEQVIQQISTALDIDAQETAVTDENGEAVFRGLADGIYYIKAVNAKGYGTVEPVLVHLPFSSAGTGAGSRLEYEVYAKPKASASPSRKKEYILYLHQVVQSMESGR